MSRKDEFGGVGYSRDNIEQLRTAICAWLGGDRATMRTVAYVNPHVFLAARTNQAVRQCLAEADIAAVDGLGFALGVRWLRKHRQTRTVMTPLFDRVLASGDLPRARAVLIGGTQQVAEKGAAAVNAISRNIFVSEAWDGYRPIGHYLRLLREQADCDVVLVAMGTPRSEELLVAAKPLLRGKLIWNIGGGTLHFYAGTLRRVPEVVSRAGMQWLWRIVHEPRIAPRYVVGIPLYLACLLRLAISQKLPFER